MFKLSLSKTYFFPVNVEIAVDGGKFDKSTFDAEFKRLPKSEIRAILDRLPKNGVPAQDPITDDEIINSVLVGWKGVADENGELLAYSETSRDVLTQVQGVSNGIINAYFASITGSKAKN